MKLWPSSEKKGGLKKHNPEIFFLLDICSSKFENITT